MLQYDIQQIRVNNKYLNSLYIKQMNKQINPNTMANLLACVLSVCNPNCKISNYAKCNQMDTQFRILDIDF